MFSDGGGGNKQHVGGRDSAAVCRDTEETKSKLVWRILLNFSNTPDMNFINELSQCNLIRCNDNFNDNQLIISLYACIIRKSLYHNDRIWQ